MKDGSILYGEAKDNIFIEAHSFLENKQVVLPKNYKKIEEWSKSRAFTVQGYTSLEILRTFLEELEKSVKEGSTKEVFRERMNSFLEDKGYEGLNPTRANTIYLTNIQTAFNVGHYENMTDPMVKKLRPYWQYHTAGNEEVRESHRVMEGRVYPADDPIWNIWYPPNGFGCRCIVTTLSTKQFEEGGYELSTTVPYDIDFGTGELLFKFPDKGFSNNPAKVDWKPNISDYPKELQAIFADRERRKGQRAKEE